ETALDTLVGELLVAANANVSNFTNGCGVAPVSLSETTCTITYDYTILAGDDASDGATDGVINNQVSVDSHPTGFTNDIDASDTALVNLFVPAISVDKSVTPTISKVTDDVAYTIVITNTSSSISLSDAQIPDLEFDAIDDTIAGDLFTALEGEACSLNTSSDGVGWFELINLSDPTPGDGADDCYILTVGLCCSDPVLNPVWPFLSQYIECPCFEGQDVLAIPPDFDFNGDQLDGFGAGSQARVAGRCEDDNYSATFTVPPGDYAYQINADLNCAGSVIPCDTPDDCAGSACIAPNPDYTVVFTTESCLIAACCVGETCIRTNRLDCAAQGGTYLGDGDQPIDTCQAGACALGACCLDGSCNDDTFHDTQAECEADGGVYFGSVDCNSAPCPACPYDSPQNCQQVQTIFGAVPLMDRNPENGSSDGTMGAVLADDVKFAGASVDQICWSTGFFATPCCGTGCAQNVDTTWQIRIYETDQDCDALPGLLIDTSTITVLNKIQGIGQGTATWHYSGSLDTPITLPNGGFVGDTYWFEVSAFGDPGCEVRATWSRDHGNGHRVDALIATENEDRDYTIANVDSEDVGFCENSGVQNPGDVLGACCTCPANCQENVTARECGVIRGVWSACATCAETPCPSPPANDNCESPYLISNVPQSTDGLDVLTITDQNNICAHDDGPGLSAAEPTGLCGPSLGGGADMHNDIWYKYTPPVTADLRIESCGAADMDQMLAVYDADNGCPVTEDEELACGDDTCGITAGPADVTVRVTAGHEYLIRCGGWNNEVPGGFDGSPRGSFSLNWSLTNVLCPGVEDVIRAGPPHDILKNRYISIDPRGVAQTLPNAMHIRVAVDSTLVPGLIGFGPWWATDPVNGQPPSPASCISIVSATKPASEPDFTGCNVVHLTGCPVIPTTTYLIQAEVGGELSCGSLFDTMAKANGKWLGDCCGSFTGPPDYVWTGPNRTVGIDDAVAAIKTFINPNAVNATHLSVTDIHPVQNGEQINLIVNINDVLIIIAGFQGKTYGKVASPFPDDEIPDLTECP
ncbi:MAG: hypothetical protein IH987_16850, partial [Planctomycetes bacterium]|nr:hypothetical protein [Planctomycetota bacterium]